MILSVLFFAVLPRLHNFYPLEDDGNEIDAMPMPDLAYLGERIFLEPDPEVGKKVENWNESYAENPEELGEYAEGDIVFPKRTRNGLVGETYRWKNGVVPYEISSSFGENDRSTILRAMELYKKYTCISFRPRQSTDSDYVSIVAGNTGCWSSVGKIGGRQEVNLQRSSCTTKVGTPLHELMHAIGFLHEQNRNERDDYVTIAWQNVKKGHENNFDKAEKGKAEGFGVKYDFRSVMHYSSTAFSVNGKPTIIPKDPKKVEKMGQRDGFSKGDISKINAMYGCPQKTDEVIGKITTSAPSTGNEAGASEPGSSNPLQYLLSLFFKKR